MAKEKAEKSEEKKESAVKVSTIKNDVEPGSSDVYVARANFTTIVGGESIAIKIGEKVTPKTTPRVWINQAVAQNFLVTEEDWKLSQKKK